MKPPSTTLLLTLNDRSPETMDRVFTAIAGQREVPFIVFDRPTPDTLEHYLSKWDCHPRKFIQGERGWLCSAKAWNVGFSLIQSEYVICMSSDALLAEGTILRIKELIGGPPVAVFGRCEDDGPVPLLKGSDSKVLCDAAHPRPLGFIMAVPMWAIRTMGGYDESLMNGLWFEDDDFAVRLFDLGIPFVFDDAVSGTHLHHDRPALEGPEGAAKIQTNREIMMQKHGSEHPWNNRRKIGWSVPGFSAMVAEHSPIALEVWTRWASSSPSPRLQAIFAQASRQE